MYTGSHTKGSFSVVNVGTAQRSCLIVLLVSEGRFQIIRSLNNSAQVADMAGVVSDTNAVHSSGLGRCNRPSSKLPCCLKRHRIGQELYHSGRQIVPTSHNTNLSVVNHLP